MIGRDVILHGAYFASIIVQLLIKKKLHLPGSRDFLSKKNATG